MSRNLNSIGFAIMSLVLIGILISWQFDSDVEEEYEQDLECEKNDKEIDMEQPSREIDLSLGKGLKKDYGINDDIYSSAEVIRVYEQPSFSNSSVLELVYDSVYHGRLYYSEMKHPRFGYIHKQMIDPMVAEKLFKKLKGFNVETMKSMGRGSKNGCYVLMAIDGTGYVVEVRNKGVATNNFDMYGTQYDDERYNKIQRLFDKNFKLM